MTNHRIGGGNCIVHRNKWWWGETITLVVKNGCAVVEIQLDDNYPTIAFVKGLIVQEDKRREGIGTKLLRVCERVAKEEGYLFIQLTANKEQDWLVKWYESLGYRIIMKDEHEFSMLKQL